MKKITLALITVLLFGVKTINGQEQEPSASEPISSGCLSRGDGELFDEETPALPAIKLTKKGSVLSVDLLNYESNCGTTNFEMEHRISGGNDDNPSSVVISVAPVVPRKVACICPFNISYTVRGLEKNNFYFACWWFDGQVELTEGEPLVLEYKAEDVVIEGLKFTLLKTTHQAMLLSQDSWDGESQILKIPSEVEYEGEKYTVTSINKYFLGYNITNIIIPKAIKNIGFSSVEGINDNPFSACMSLQTIEVEEGNPAICSVDGVLFNKDKTTLIGYPRASLRESYIVPDGVATIGQSAFYDIENLKKVVLPDCVETLNQYSFQRSKSLEEVILSPNIKELPASLFAECAKLKSVIIPEGVTSIGESAFQYCSSLESISLPASVVTVGRSAFMDCTSLKSATLSPNLKEIPFSMFSGCSKLTEIIIPSGITSIDNCAFYHCESIQSLDLPESINNINGFVFENLSNLKDLYCHATTIPNTHKEAFNGTNLSQATLHVPAASVSAYQAVEPWKDFKEIVALEEQMPYRPMIEDGKVWKVGYGSRNPIQFVEYYYFDGDTIIDGRTCKQMMRQRYVTPDYVDYDFFIQYPLLGRFGDLYEEDKKVYVYDYSNKKFLIEYDFTLDAYDTLWLDEHASPFVVGPRQTGGIKGFKGVYRDVFMIWDEEQSIYNNTWLEGVGGIEGPLSNVYYQKNYHSEQFLMSCTVGDEVIYLNDEYEDGATPEGIKDRKRFDFTHTIKTQPKAPRKEPSQGEESQLYGEYNNLQLGINLDPLDEAYTVRITDGTGKVVYEKAINAASIVGLNIDISTYAAGRYTVTVENSQESFTGEFEVQKQTVGIDEIDLVRAGTGACPYTGEGVIYNLQGQRIRSLQKGLNIVNGQKVYVK